MDLNSIGTVVPDEEMGLGIKEEDACTGLPLAQLAQSRVWAADAVHQHLTLVHLSLSSDLWQTCCSRQVFPNNDQMGEGFCLTCVTYATSDVTIKTHCEGEL